MKIMGYLKTSLILSLIFIAVATANPMDARADYGASIERTSCDPKTNLVYDNTKNESEELDGDTYYPFKSCTGQRIRYDEFKVKVKFEPDMAYINAYVGVNTVMLIGVYFGVYMAAYTPAFVACSIPPFAGPHCFLIANSVGLGAIVVTMYGLALGQGGGTKEAYIRVGDSRGLVDGLAGLPPLAVASVTMMGDKACVTLQSRPMPFLNFEAQRTSEFNTKYNIDAVNATSQQECEDAETDGGYEPGSICFPQNCVAMPLPPSAEKPPAPPFISRACMNYDNTASQFVWPIDPATNQVHGRSFIGVVVQCVEESMTNLFFNAHTDVGVAASGAKSVFVRLQEKLQGYILAMLALYIIVLGYKHGIMDRGGIKNQDFIFAIVKVGCIMFFASGSGMTQLAPGLIGSVKELSAIVLDAAIGVEGDKTATIAKKNLANTNYIIASADYNNKRNIWWSHMNEDDSDNHVTNMKVAMDAAKIVMDNANKELQKAKVSMLSFGYDYCNFKPFVEAGKYKHSTVLQEDTTIPYDTKDGNGNVLTAGTVLPKDSTVIRDMRSMYLWDSIDCRISRYLGIGLNNRSPEAPQFLLVAIGMLASFNPIGWIIFALSVVFIIFVILIIIRTVQIYIISFVSIVLLIYVSPLIFPLMLFEHTKSSFDRWFKQVLGYMLQPIILFGFLAFMFAVFDNIIWGNNDTFYPSVKSHLYEAPKVSDHSIQRINKISGTTAGCLNPPNKVDSDYEAKRLAFLDNCRCPDEDAIGCMLERFDISKTSVTVSNSDLFTVYNVTREQDGGTATLTPTQSENADAPDCNADIANATSSECRSRSSSSSQLSDADRITYMLGLLKALFACFIIHALLGQIERISETLTNSAMPASRMATVPAATPQAIAAASKTAAYRGGKMAVGAAGKVAGLAGKVARSAGNAVDGLAGAVGLGSPVKNTREAAGKAAGKAMHAMQDARLAAQGGVKGSGTAAAKQKADESKGSGWTWRSGGSGGGAPADNSTSDPNANRS